MNRFIKIVAIVVTPVAAAAIIFASNATAAPGGEKGKPTPTTTSTATATPTTTDTATATPTTTDTATATPTATVTSDPMLVTMDCWREDAGTVAATYGPVATEPVHLTYTNLYLKKMVDLGQFDANGTIAGVDVASDVQSVDATVFHADGTREVLASCLLLKGSTP